jgi:beta-galactosidase/beta-glucuronidase
MKTKKLIISALRCWTITILAACCSTILFAAPVPVAGDAPVPVDRLRPGNTSVLPLTGAWRFRIDHGTSPAVRGELPADAPIPDFATTDASDIGWTNIPVPANWEIEGFSIPTYQERPVTSHDIGLYRRWMDIPANFAGQTVLWHFDAAYDGAEVFVNGQRCGYHESGFTAFDIDVTKAIKAGQRNLMAVRLYKDTSSAALDHGDFWCLGGISRETFLVALPPLHVDDVTVVTDLDDQYKDATLKSTVRILGAAGSHFVLIGELYSLDGAKVAVPAMTQAGDIGADGSATVSLSAPVKAPNLWSAEKPNLYYVFYRLSDGNKTVERVQDRIGFRKVELKNGVVQVNGVPVKFTGVCRHDEWLTLGHALDEACWKTDLALMKNANVSAIRTAHYNHAARFLELCDEAGFYVLDEIPSCWVSSEINNTNRTWAYVFRSKETLARDKNRACVVAWSCGNESSYGVNNQAEFDYMKANDSTRLALISQVSPRQNPKTDFDDYHYPSIASMKAMITNAIRARVPAIYTEIGGIEDPWGQILYDNWAPIWSSDGITGAFIWEWQEQNIVDKFPERWTVNSPGARPTDRTTGLRPSGGGGAVTADRQIKPNRYWNLKIVYSPVVTSAREIEPAGAVNQDGRGQCVVPIQNRYSFTDLSELTCRYQLFAGEKMLASGESHVAAKPRSTVDAQFPFLPGMDTLRLEFIHPDGRSVYATRLHAKGWHGPAAPAALAPAGPVRLSDTEQNVTVQTAGTQLVLNKQTGQITSWRAGDEAVVLSGPVLNLGESITGVGTPRVGGGVAVGPGGRGGRGAAPVISAQAPQLRNLAVTSGMDGANAKLSVTADVYLAGSDEPKGQLNYTLNIAPDAQADVSWKLAWKAAAATAREAGLKFLLPAATARMSWFSDGLWTEYPADHIAVNQGSATGRDTAFSSTRRDVRWLNLSGAGNYSLVALSAGKPLHTHGLVDNNGTTLFLSSGIASTGRDVTGDEIRLSETNTLTGAFRLRLALTAKPAAASASAFDSIAPVPVAGDMPVPVERLRPGNTNVVPMTGTWRFRVERGPSPAVRGELPADAAVPDFATTNVSDANWTNILVPANWEIEGFSPLTFQERPATSHDIGLYRRLVNIPASFAAQTVLWPFDAAYDGAAIFVNGQRCGYHESGFTAFDIDVTKAIKPGQRNLFAVRLYKDTSSASLDHGDFWVLGGIYRETYLKALPPLHVDDVTVVTDLDAQYKDATLKSTVRLAGPAGARFVLTCDLYSLDKTRVAIPAMSRAGEIGSDGSAVVALSAPVTAPKLWSAEKPDLYYVFYRLSDGSRTVERVQDRIGFRKLENKGGVQLINGVPVKYCGICRMEEFTPYGHAMNEECWTTDIALMKQDNINAIRLSHYDHAERFMELCDEAGFYLLDEIPACWIASEVRDGSRTWAYVLRTQETMNRDKNRPSVVAWACGNESGYGVNNQAMFDYAKAHDSTRPAFISQQNQRQNPKTDFEDYHYPTFQQLKDMANPSHAQIPVIITEQHSTDVGVAEVTNFWNVIWPADNIVGSFIWEWQDQGMYDKFPERWATPAHGAAINIPKTGFRDAHGFGPATAERQLTPMFDFLKALYSPILTTAREVAPASGKCVVPIQNRYSFTDLSELTCQWQALAGDKVLAGGETRIAAKPRSSVEASFPAPAGMDSLRLEFIHPDGRSICASTLRAKS